MPRGSDPLCQAEACALQACLSKNTYAQEKCTEKMRNLYKCCQALYDDVTEDRGESSACPMPSVVRRWLKSHP
ncbi:DUF1903-domain-containing protein [Lactarius psammicola]|nr:DUF1903-domain-containing protein [Lactarius psammicola]